MLKSKNVDITGGPILQSIVLYAVPVIIGSLLQVLFNAADLIVLKQMAGEMAENATASVGATSTIVGLVANTFIGLSSGTSVLLARSLGSGDDKRVRRVVSTSVLASVAFGILATVVFLVGSRPLLEITKCPSECMSGAMTYLFIYALGTPAIVLYNFGAAIIRTSGDTKRPLYYLMISGVLNVALNFVMCLVLTEKVAAVAIATVASQALAAVLVLIHLIKLDGCMKFSVRNLSFSFSELWSMLKIGIPTAINSVLFAVSNMQLQSEINAYGQAAMAGSAAANSVDNICVSIANGFSAATLPFVGQNVGAEKPERVKKSIFWCALLSCSSSIVLAAVLYLARYPLFSLFLSGNEAIEYAIAKMSYIIIPYFLVFLYNVFVSSMNAFGYSFVPTINTVITVLGFRFVWISFIYPVVNTPEPYIGNLYISYALSWILCLIAQFTAFSIIYSRYKKGKLRKI